MPTYDPMQQLLQQYQSQFGGTISLGSAPTYTSPSLSPTPHMTPQQEIDAIVDSVKRNTDENGKVDLRIIGRETGARRDIAEQVLQKMGYKLKEGAEYIYYLVEPEKPKVSIDSVVLSKEKKDEIREAMSQVGNSEIIFKEWGFGETFEKGTAVTMLFWGIPGTGKTLTAQAIADELGKKVNFYGTAQIESSEPGGAERNIQQIFKQAKKDQTIIVFDECDSLLVDRNEVGPILGAQINCLLGEIEKYEGVIIFTTNRLGKLDPALERRISAKIEFVFPDKDARKKIWERMMPKKAPIDKNVDFSKLADYPICGGNIKNAVLNAARTAAYQKSKTIKMEHFVTAIERESAALQAFVAEYENSSHTGVGQQISRSTHGITLTKQVIKQKKMEKIHSILGGKK